MTRVLIVDDEPAFRQIVKRLLEPEGFQVFEAVDGASGLDTFKANPVEIVITDILMPRQDGFQFIKKLRELGLNITIIATSGGGQLIARDFLERIDGFGADFVLTKPFDTKRFLDLICGVRDSAHEASGSVVFQDVV